MLCWPDESPETGSALARTIQAAVPVSGTMDGPTRMNSPQSFGPVAPYYDELMRTVPYKMWVSYYLLLLSHQDVHPKTVLDVCCGTGTMCQMLDKEGFRMSGIDLSPGMIEAAVAKAKKRKLDIYYEVADASTFILHRKFDAALSFFDSLNNILEPEKLQAAFHRVAAHLPPGGSWIFDLNTAYAFSASLFDQQDLRPNAKLQYLWEGDYDPATKIITVNMRFWRDDQE
ncbi:MAG TPA: class I SAM-dependent methyltransferase, partial [Fimbriimonas sp.]|nr:class I SAM-dependent methyltransferase [Fimbriimonas sp.]